MKSLNLNILFFAVMAICSCASVEKEESMEQVIAKGFAHAEQQAILMAKSLENEESRLPRTLDKYGKLITSDPLWWTSGFFPGTLWYIYENSKSEEVKKYALMFTDRVEKAKHYTGNHDVGFMVGCSFGNAYRLMGGDINRDVILTGAKSLMTRYKPEVGLIRSWDWNQKVWKYPVIIDNMMNLEILLWASEQTKDKSFYDAAVSHAQKTMEHHFRDDHSCYHVVSYDPETGLPHIKQTSQGYSDNSSWARGQGWALYGYTMMHRGTGSKEFLNHARNVANYIIDHPNMPEDMVPYWDFDAPDQPNCYRDASAASLIASALIELSQYVDDKDEAAKYLAVAEKQIRSLASEEYSVPVGTHGNFILKKSVGALPGNSEVDKPLTYADYYYVEAMMRYKNLKGYK